MVGAVASSPAPANAPDSTRSLAKAESRAMRRAADTSEAQSSDLARDAQAVRDLHASRTFESEASRYADLRNQAQNMRVDSASFDQALEHAVSN